MKTAAIAGPLVFAASLLLAASCGSSSAPKCTPGASVACTGPGGCTGGQVCGSDGESYGECACGGASEAGTLDATASGLDATASGLDATASGVELDATLVDGDSMTDFDAPSDARAGPDGSADGSQDSAGSTADASADAAALDANAEAMADASPDAADAGVDAAPDGGATATLSFEFNVVAGDEVFMCQQFGNPFGVDVDIIEASGQMSDGSHQLIVFDMDPSTGRNGAAPLEACPYGGLEIHPFVYWSQQPSWDVSYQFEAGMGTPLPAANGLMLYAHFVNVTSTAIVAQATVTITTAVPGAVTQPVGTLLLENESFSVPANTPESSPLWASTSGTPAIGSDWEILQSWSYMQQYGLEFQAFVGSATTPFYQQSEWLSPQVLDHASPIQVPQGTSLTWECQYYNPTSATMTFGESALTDVQCVYLGVYSPADPANADIVLP